MIPASRRLMMTGLLGLGGCGFRPVYAPPAAGGTAFSQVLSQIYVPVLPERSGQLLRQALQARLDGPGDVPVRQYELIPVLRIATEAIAIQRDNSTSRMRVDATASWVLRALTPTRPVVAQNSTRMLDGYNIINQQFFAADLESDVVQRRVVTGLADQIVLQLAAYFQRATP